jgi:hypothetical protein
MGYTHYWKGVARFDKGQFAKVVRDFKKVMKHLAPFVPLASGSGKKKAVINNECAKRSLCEQAGQSSLAKG